MRIFVDGSDSFWKPENRTGIQRVVREVCRRCGTLAPLGSEVRPVQFDGRRWGAWSSNDGIVFRAYAWARALTARSRASRRLAKASLRVAPFSPIRLALFLGSFLTAAVSAMLATVFRLALTQCARVELSPGDVLLVLDYPLQRQACIAEARAKGVRVVVVIYDCIPVSHPQFVGGDGAFGRHLRWLVEQSEGVMTISAFSEQEIRRLLPVGGRWTDHFPLAADFPVSAGGEPRPELHRAVAAPCFLMVGTIAPHKNHKQALDAMEALWAAGGEAHLLIVGKVGWQSNELLGRISIHPELGRRLFVFHDLDDDELAYAYGRSHALITTSYIEGFGLPLVEALGRGLPVLAVDIPVFREVGGHAVEFFPLDDAAALAQVLRRRAKEPRQEVLGWRSPDWDDATRQLLTKVATRMRS